MVHGGCVDPVPTPGVPITGGCPSWWETHPRGIPVPEGCPSRGCPFWGYAHPFGMFIPGKNPSQGMSWMLNSHPGGVPTPVGGLSQEDAHSDGMPILEGCPFQRDAHPGGSPSQRDAHPRRIAMPAEHLPTTELHPTFATAFLSLWSDPTHGCGAVCGASGHLCPLWPLPR